MAEMERSSADSLGKFDGDGVVRIPSRRRRFGSSGPGDGPGEGIRSSQSSSGVGLSDALQLPKEDLASAVRVLRASEASAVRRMCGGAAPDHHGHLARVQVELLASAYCAARRTEGSNKHLTSVEGLCRRHHRTLDGEEQGSG